MKESHHATDAYSVGRLNKHFFPTGSRNYLFPSRKKV